MAVWVERNNTLYPTLHLSPHSVRFLGFFVFFCFFLLTVSQISGTSAFSLFRYFLEMLSKSQEDIRTFVSSFPSDTAVFDKVPSGNGKKTFHTAWTEHHIQPRNSFPASGPTFNSSICLKAAKFEQIHCLTGQLFDAL